MRTSVRQTIKSVIIVFTVVMLQLSTGRASRVGILLFNVYIHCEKYPYTIHRYFVASFPYFNGTGSVNVCNRKSTE